MQRLGQTGSNIAIEGRLSLMTDSGIQGPPEYIPRAGQIHLVDNMVSTVIGARRAGKSSRLMQEASQCVQEKRIAEC